MTRSDASKPSLFSKPNNTSLIDSVQDVRLLEWAGPSAFVFSELHTENVREPVKVCGDAARLDKL